MTCRPARATAEALRTLDVMASTERPDAIAPTDADAQDSLPAVATVTSSRKGVADSGGRAIARAGGQRRLRTAGPRVGGTHELLEPQHDVRRKSADGTVVAPTGER